ncbi:hypothetical protein PVAG01_01477 [Phlyctema vagabunda]|uniref:Uncharacterized protein n=1 Tax=Phlyctema vagabunda TaxID=108571 RepID=A0ABR4PX81_9HELO
MDHTERDIVIPRAPANLTGGAFSISRSDKPLFASRERARSYFASVADDATRDGNEDVESPTTARRPGGAGSWMDTKATRRLGLGEAFYRTDENGLLQPRSPQVVVPGREGLRTEMRSEIRAARRASYTPDATPSPPPRTLSAAYKLAIAEERSASAPHEGGRVQQSPIDGSPSPATRSRALSRDSNKENRPHQRNSASLDMRGRTGSPLIRHYSDGNTDDGTNESSRSSLSNLSLVEDPTEDEFDEKMRKFSRDQERVAELLRRKSGPFARRDSSKSTETLKTQGKKSNTSSPETEPPYQPPRTWGSKAKKMDHFLTKVMSPESSSDNQDPPRSQKQDQSPSAKQRTAADTPLPSVEDGRPVQEPTPPLSRPTSSAQTNNMASWDTDLDFTAQSIMTSPQLRVKTTKLDDIRNRELQSLSKSAIASSQLEEIRERNSEERSRSPELDRRSLRSRQSKSPPPKPEPSGEEPAHEKTILEEEGEHIHGTPMTGPSLNLSNDKNNNINDNARNQRPGRENKNGHTENAQDLSRDVLRRLSRATSASPVEAHDRKQAEIEVEKKTDDTAKDKGKGIDTGAESVKSAHPKPPQEDSKRPGHPRDDSLKRLSLGLELDKKRLSSTSTPSKSDADPEERIAAEASLFALNDNKSQSNSVRTSSPNSDDAPVDATPRPKADPLSRPTPRVTGAYIETPAFTNRGSRLSRELFLGEDLANTLGRSGATGVDIGSSLASRDPMVRERGRAMERGRSPRSRSQPIMPTTRPPLRNSANPSKASEDLRRIRRESQIDDSTLDDFDELLEADARATANLKQSRIEPALDFEHDVNGRELSGRERQQRLETLALERMSNSLKRTSVSIRDAKRGIEGLEDQVSSSNTNLPRHTRNHSHIHNCPACAEGSSTYHLSIPVPRLYTRTPPNNRRKLTWLGLLLSIFFAWFLTESVMCEFFCKPEFQNYTGMWTPWEPSFPYVIPSKLDYWSGRRVSGVAYEVYNIWTDGKRRRPRWAGPEPRPQMEQPPPGYVAPPRIIVKKPKSEFWSWFWGDEVAEHGDKSRIEIVYSTPEPARGKSKKKAKVQKQHTQPQDAGWNWPGFRTSTKETHSSGRASWAGEDDEEDDEEAEEGYEGSMFEDETI